MPPFTCADVMINLVVRVPHPRYRRRHRGRARRNDLDDRGPPHMETLVPRSLRFAALVRAPHTTRTRCPNQIRYAIVNGTSAASVVGTMSLCNLMVCTHVRLG